MCKRENFSLRQLLGRETGTVGLEGSGFALRDEVKLPHLLLRERDRGIDPGRTSLPSTPTASLKAGSYQHAALLAWQNAGRSAIVVIPTAPARRCRVRHHGCDALQRLMSRADARALAPVA
jgi:hypothetical protein